MSVPIPLLKLKNQYIRLKVKRMYTEPHDITSATRKVVENFYKALSEQNLEKIARQFSENPDWYIPGDMTYESIFTAHFEIKDNLIVYYRFQEDSNALVKALC